MAGKCVENMGKINRYPFIEKTLAGGKFDRLMKEGKHPLVWLLSKDELDKVMINNLREEAKRYLKNRSIIRSAISVMIARNLLYEPAVRSHLEECLKLLGSEMAKDFKKDLRNSEQFLDTLSEVEFCCLFKGRFKPVIHPKLPYFSRDGKKREKRTGLRVTIGNRDMFFEIITPRPFSEIDFKIGKCGFEPLPKRAAEIIVEEFEEHFWEPYSSGSLLKKIPIVFAINASFSGMDGIQVESAWDEALQLNPETRLVSAVILYKSRVGFNGQISLWWSIFKNPFAINPHKRKRS